MAKKIIMVAAMAAATWAVAKEDGDCETLNRKFGVPERIAFRPSKDTGAPVAALTSRHGSCEIDLMGARVLSYLPAGQRPVLFLPRSMKLDPPAWKHGGIPVCWPWFGRNGEPGSVVHGFARQMTFSVRSAKCSDDATEITLALTSSDETRRIWPYDFELELKVSVSTSLDLVLTARNTGKEKFWYTEGFHPYFSLSDAAATSVRGLDGATVCDARAAKADGSPFNAKDFSATWQGDLMVDRDYDHVFTPKGGEFAIFDPKLNRTIAIRAQGNKKLVVWHPTPDYDKENMEPGDCRRMVCVEPATLFRDEGAWLEPNATHRLRMTIQSNPGDGSVR